MCQLQKVFAFILYFIGCRGADSTSPNLLAGIKGPLHNREGNRKRDVKELGTEKGRKSRRRVLGEGQG